MVDVSLPVLIGGCVTVAAGSAAFGYYYALSQLEKKLGGIVDMESMEDLVEGVANEQE